MLARFPSRSDFYTGPTKVQNVDRWYECDEIMMGVDSLKAHFHARDNTLPKLPFSSGPLAYRKH